MSDSEAIELAAWIFHILCIALSLVYLVFLIRIRDRSDEISRMEYQIYKSSIFVILACSLLYETPYLGHLFHRHAQYEPIALGIRLLFLLQLVESVQVIRSSIPFQSLPLSWKYKPLLILVLLYPAFYSYLPSYGEIYFVDAQPVDLHSLVQTPQASPVSALSVSSLNISNALEREVFHRVLASQDLYPEFEAYTDSQEEVVENEVIVDELKILSRHASNSIQTALLVAFSRLGRKVDLKRSVYVSWPADMCEDYPECSLKPADQIVSANQVPISSSGDLLSLLDGYRKRTMKFEVIRNGRQEFLEQLIFLSRKGLDRYGFEFSEEVKLLDTYGIKINGDQVLYGDSIGLACALHVYFALSQNESSKSGSSDSSNLGSNQNAADLSGSSPNEINKVIYATGAINSDGTVEAVGGLFHKAVLAAMGDAGLLILPATMEKEWHELVKKHGVELLLGANEVSFVTSFDEALESSQLYLAELSPSANKVQSSQ